MKGLRALINTKGRRLDCHSKSREGKYLGPRTVCVGRDRNCSAKQVRIALLGMRLRSDNDQNSPLNYRTMYFYSGKHTLIGVIFTIILKIELRRNDEK